MSNDIKIVCLQDYEENAIKVLPPFVLDYYKGGADQEQTLRDNHEAFKRYCYLKKLSCTVFNVSLYF